MNQDATKRFHVPEHGNVSRSNAVFLFCEQMDKVDALDLGQSAEIRFRSGAGKSTVTITRTN